MVQRKQMDNLRIALTFSLLLHIGTQVTTAYQSKDVSPLKDGGVIKEQVVRDGKGPSRPLMGDIAEVHYVLSLPDGTVTTSTRAQGKRAKITVGQNVMMCTTYALMSMARGESSKFWCSTGYVYGGNFNINGGLPDKVPVGSKVILNIELFDWEWKGDEDITPGRDGGLLMKTLIAGPTNFHPEKGTIVNVHVTGMNKGGVFEDRNVRYSLGEGFAQGLAHGVDVALSTMSSLQTCRLQIKAPQYGYRNSKPGSDLRYILRLTSFKNKKHIAQDVTPNKDGGVMKEILTEGSGNDYPLKGDVTSVHYVLFKQDGKVVDSSRLRKLRVNSTMGKKSLFPCWDMAQMAMKRGEVAMVTCKPKYAYGNKQFQNIPPHSTLKMEIELFGFTGGADITPSSDRGVLMNTLTKAVGQQSPGPGNVVLVHVNGYTVDGLEFQNTQLMFTQGRAKEQDLVEAIDMAVLRMKLGQTVRLQVSPKYGYKSEGHTKYNIPGNAPLTYLLTLKKIVKGKNSHTATTTRKSTTRKTNNWRKIYPTRRQKTRTRRPWNRTRRPWNRTRRPRTTTTRPTTTTTRPTTTTTTPTTTTTTPTTTKRQTTRARRPWNRTRRPWNRTRRPKLRTRRPWNRTTKTTTTTRRPTTTKSVPKTYFKCFFDDNSLCGMQQENTDDFDWKIAHRKTPSRSTGPDGPLSGRYFIYIEASNRKENDKARIILPSAPKSGYICIEFGYNMHGYHINRLTVYTMDKSKGRKEVWTKQGNLGKNWAKAKVRTQVQQDDKVVFEGVTGKGFTGDIALDDIVLSTC